MENGNGKWKWKISNVKYLSYLYFGAINFCTRR